MQLWTKGCQSITPRGRRVSGSSSPPLAAGRRRRDRSRLAGLPPPSYAATCVCLGRRISSARLHDLVDEMHTSEL